MQFSSFGNKLGANSGITSLMDDLGEAMSGESDMIMMGGGNPAHIPEVQAIFRSRLEKILQNQDDFQALIGTYDPPQGNMKCIRAVKHLLNSEYGWQLSDENICLTNGSQSAFFMLFNLLAGKFDDGSYKQVQLPLTPEYIGYSDAGINDNFFHANQPCIEEIDGQTFKYHVDFNRLTISESCAAICVSRPTNPTGNVLTDNEISKLDLIAKANDIPLIIDGAYGTPFPNLIYSDATPIWNDNIVLCLSLSKFGLPAARTGIVIANEVIIKSLSSMNAIMNLATNSFGSLISSDLIQSKEILSLSRHTIQPFYFDKAKRARDYLLSKLNHLPVKLHKVEGAMFLWLWLKDCPVSNEIIYQRLKSRGVLIVSGHHFFPGLAPAEFERWRHTKECLRITFSQDDERVRAGLDIISDEVERAYAQP